MNLGVVIMAGGAGTRFWPLSTAQRPKQFLRLLGDRTLLQESFERAVSLTDPERVFVLTGAQFVAEVRTELPLVPPENIVGEPMRRDTAAAVALGSLLLQERLGEAVMVVLTADHLIQPLERFRDSILSAVQGAAGTQALYTLGIPPRYPATGYGYLELGAEVEVAGEAPEHGAPGTGSARGADGTDAPVPPVAADGAARHYRLHRFREKPDRATAEEFVASGRFLWNSGMFIWRAEAILQEFRRQLPRHLEVLEPAVVGGGVNPEALRRAFADLPAVSVDYGIMEGAEDVRTVAATFEWDDLGGWESLAAFLASDEGGNRYRGRLVAYEARSNVVFSEDPAELVALLGVDHLTVVRAGARTLIAPRERSQEIKDLVRELEQRGEGDVA